MSRATVVVVLTLIGGAVLLLAPGEPAVSQTIREVFVTNFPEVQRVEGRVAVEGAVRLAELVTFPNIHVPPVRPSDTTRLVDAGRLVTDGFPNVVLSLHGVVKGEVFREGDVGAILIPDQETIQLAFNEQGLMQFALEVGATGVSSRTPFFASNQPRHVVGFHAYRVLLYNTTDKTVTVNLFAYLTS